MGEKVIFHRGRGRLRRLKLREETSKSLGEEGGSMTS